MRSVFLIATVVFTQLLQAQVLNVVDSSQSGVSFRGLSVVDEKTIWVSGSKGTIGRSVDGGQTWQWLNPPGFSKRDFRDIEAFDANTAIAMAVDSPGILLKTKDGGKTWQVVYESNQSGIFLDAMDFAGLNGYCIGDPINGKFWLLQTTDGGDHWSLLDEKIRPDALAGEACFAASGTNILAIPTNEKSPGGFVWVTGGRHSRLHLALGGPAESLPLDLMQGNQMTGSNSVAILPSGGLVVAAGDYLRPNRSDSCLIYLNGKQQTLFESSPIGYASCITTSWQSDLLICGLNGVAVAPFDGDDEIDAWSPWEKISTTAFHVVQMAGKAKVAFAAGPKGRIAKISW